MKTLSQWTVLGLILCCSCARALAGGSGLNVVVIVNQNSPDSVELGNYYCEKRGVPPQNVLRVNWAGGKVNWTRAEFEATLRAPLNAMLATRGLSNQIEYVLLSMDFPYRVIQETGAAETSGQNSTTSALFYGFKPDGCTKCPAGLPSCNLAPTSLNLFAGTEGIYRQTPPNGASSNNWMVMMLTSSNLAMARSLVDRGVASDSSFPTQSVYLAKTFDAIRTLRYLAADDAIFDVRVRGNYSILATNISSTAGLMNLLGFQNGVQLHTVTPNAFVPGALADNLTSYSGAIFENSGHTDALDYIIAGATASYGTVVEPCAYPEKFASPRNYFYQARGFSAAECYYLSVTNPYQGILVGEPLSAPFARSSTGGWVGLPTNSLLVGTTNLSLQFSAADETRPLQQVDLFLDGTLLQTLTNIPPRPGNRLYVTLPGRTNLTYTVPAGASLATVANGLAALLNSPVNSSVTRVDAYAHGDRLELRSSDVNRPGGQTFVTVSNYVGTASELTTFIRPAAATFPDTTAYGRVICQVGGTVVVGDTLTLNATKTNGALVSVSVTNSASTSLIDFVQLFASAINAEPALQGADGLVVEDFVNGSSVVQFNLRARSLGIQAAQLQVAISGTFDIAPSGSVSLTENLPDLQPRNHLYLTDGRTHLSFSFPFNTATIADGYHELSAVAYEGSHVRTQKRISQSVRIQNNPWSATFTALVGGTNTALEATLQFAVQANTGSISKIELFSTGGLLAGSNNVSSATFPVPAASLGAGLHPFYALVSRSDGTSYRTETRWFRIIGTEQPFRVSIAGVPPTLTWPASAGRTYQVLSATEVTDTFVPRAAVTPTNSTGMWTETNTSSPQRFYRVKTP
ncbi:MAG TPA: TIGR03790 family protein [Verrucomicrobiae bacterium]|nr:TIGR03790 family protein [Verrucomicrobiae bacterium]